MSDYVKPATSEPASGAPVRMQPAGSVWYPLFAHMSDEYQLTLLDSELSEIADKAANHRRRPEGESNLPKKSR